MPDVKEWKFPTPGEGAPASATSAFEPTLEHVHALLSQLRLGLSLEDFSEGLEQARREGYRAFIVAGPQGLIGYLGGRVLTDFVHGRHFYVDDLVVDRDRRSEGVGARLLKHAEALAAREGCKGLRLCTGIENEAGKRFYEREGWKARAYAFKKKL